jgi:hypothetical protein
MASKEIRVGIAASGSLIEMHVPRAYRGSSAWKTRKVAFVKAIDLVEKHKHRRK